MNVPDRTEVRTYREATDYLQRTTSDLGLHIRESCLMDVRLMVPTSIPGISESKVLPRQCNISLQTTLPNLILMLQIEVDLYSCKLCEEGRSLQLEDARLVNSVEIEIVDSDMRAMPALKGLVTVAEGKGPDSTKNMAAKAVSWECRSGFENGNVGEYWDAYKLWLLKSTRVRDEPATLILRTVMQCAETIGDATGGHHFLKRMEDLLETPEIDVLGKEKTNQNDMNMFTVQQLEESKNLNELTTKSTMEDMVNAEPQSNPIAAAISRKRASNHRTMNEIEESKAKDKDSLQLRVCDEMHNEKQTSLFEEHETKSKNPTSKTVSAVAHRGSLQQIKGKENARPASSMPYISFHSNREMLNEEFSDSSFNISHDNGNITPREHDVEVLNGSEARRYLMKNAEDHVTPLEDQGSESALLRNKAFIERYRSLFDRARGFDREDDEVFCHGRVEQYHLKTNEFDVVNTEKSSNIMTGQQEQISRKVALESLARTTSIRSHPKVYYQDPSNDNRTTGNRPFAFLNGTMPYTLPESYATAPVATYQSSTLRRPASSTVRHGITTNSESLSLSRTMEAAKILSSGFSSPYTSSGINNHHQKMVPQAFPIQTSMVEQKHQLQTHKRFQQQHHFKDTAMQTVPQPRIIKADNQFSTGSLQGHLTSPFNHRYPTRFVSPTETIAINKSNVAPLGQSILSCQSPKTATRTFRRQSRERSSVSLNQPLANSTEDGKVPDQAYGTSLRLQNS